MNTRYNAFISYRHSDLDMEFAKKIHKGLETFTVPRAVRKKTGLRKIDRVFRDQEELPIGSDLGSNITMALENSEWLIVICSPRLPQSYWCLTEIETFIKMHDRNHVLAVLVEGEPEESFPEILRKDENGNAVEPLAADVRGTTAKERNKKFKTEIIRLLAPLLSVTYDDLRQRHRERRMHKIITWTSIAAATVAALSISFGVYNASQTQKIKRNQSMFLASQSMDLYNDGNRMDAVLVALEALPGKGNKRPLVPDAEYALSLAVNAYSAGNKLSYDRVLETELGANKISFASSEGIDPLYTQIVDANNTVYLYNNCLMADHSDTLLFTCKAEDDASGNQLQVLGTCLVPGQIVILQHDGIRAYHMDQTEVYHSTDANNSYLTYAMDGEIVAMVSGRKIDFYNMVDGTILKTFHMEDVTDKITDTLQVNQCVMQHGVLAVTMDSKQEDGTERLLLIDYMDGSVREITLPHNFVVTMAMDKETLYVVNADLTQYRVSYYEMDRPIEVQAYSLTSGEMLWAFEENDMHQYLETYDTLVKVQDNTLALSLYNRLLLVDATSGEVRATANLSHGIIDFFFGNDNLLICDNAGTIELADLATGNLASTPLISTGKDVRQVAVSEDVIALRTYLSNEVALLKYLPSSTYTEIATGDAEENINATFKSPSGNIVGGQYGFVSKEQNYRFYKVENGEEVANFTVTTESYGSSAAFIDEDTFVVVDGTGYVATYHFSTGALTECPGILESQDTMGGVSPEIHVGTIGGIPYARAYGFHDHLIYSIDLLDSSDHRMQVATHSEEDKIVNCVFGQDGNQIIALSEQLGLSTVDFDQSRFDPIGFPYQVASTLYSDSVLQLSQDGSLLAVACTDDFIRVLRTEGFSTIAEIPYVFNYRIFAYFTADNTRLLVQGDDYYLRAYDLPSGEQTYVSSSQYNSIIWIEENRENDRLVMRHGGRIGILDYDSLHNLATIPNGQLYLPDQGQLVCCIPDAVKLYRVDILSTEELIEEAHRQFPGASLDSQKRIKYYLD